MKREPYRHVTAVDPMYEEHQRHDISIDTKKRFPARMQHEGRWFYATGRRGDASRGYGEGSTRCAEYADDIADGIHDFIWVDLSGEVLKDYSTDEEE